VQLLLQQAQQAQTFVYRGNPAEREAYADGLLKLVAALEEVSKLLATGDMAAAKQALADIHKIKLQYHRKLEV
jgi:soluble cytochrome b562